MSEHLPAARNAQAKAIIDVLPTIQAMLPTMIDRGQFASAALVAANELKEQCETPSVVVAAAHAAQMGLHPGRAWKLCYFVPRKLGKRQLCQLIVSYQGYITLSTRNDYLKWVHANVVLKDEDFFVGVKDGRPIVQHKVDPRRDLCQSKVRSSMIGAYCLFETRRGGLSHYYASRQEIDYAESKSYSGIWKSENYAAMARKTPVRRAANMWNLTPELHLALRLDEQYELREPQDTGVEIDVPKAAAEIDLDAYEAPEPEIGDE